MLHTLCMHTSTPSRIARARQRTLPTRQAFITVNHKPSRSTWRGVVARVAAVPERSENAEAAILSITDSLRVLETERDEAVSTAESCARTAVKLEEMIRLLEKLALNKVAEGDEAGARDVLKEKAAVSEVLARTSTRANTNFALAAKLAEKVGQQQADLMQLLSERANKSSSSSTSTSTPSAKQQYASTSTSSSTAGSSSSRSSSGGGYGSGYEAPWERSLAEARERIQKAEAQAAAAGDAAAWRGRESLEEARERLRQQSLSSLAEARSRIRASASESIEAARARIAAEDAAVLREVHALIARYKSGQYVSEDDLDWAFRQLEKRSWRQ